MKLKLFTLLLIFFSIITLDIRAQTCTGTVLNISAPTPGQTPVTGTWTVPSGGPYLIKIQVKGGRGGRRLATGGGAGASMAGDFILNSSQVLNASAGSPGLDVDPGGAIGGGSGSAVSIGSNPLIVAGGGGGTGSCGCDGGSAQLTMNGANGAQVCGGAGGTNGGDGANGTLSSFPAQGGKGYANGMLGGNGVLGGFYSGGGGGGYSGGGGGCSNGPGGGGGSYNTGLRQTNVVTSTAGGEVIIECLGTATLSATATPTQPTCSAPIQGSVSIDVTGVFNGYTTDLEYAIVSGGIFSGNPTFSDVMADPFTVSTGTGTTTGTYTVRIRLKNNPDLYVDRIYTISSKLTGTVYVKANATGANNGSSWTDAFTSLQDALSAACSGAQIWVAAGTYKPTADASGNATPTDARTKAFVMVNGVAIYGGFDGTESQLSQRNWRTNATILSGNIGDTGVDTDNAYRVINNTFTSGSPLTNTAILDGFIVEKGYANTSPFNLGGGMWNAYASPMIRNCVFRNNFAVGGGGMFNAEAQPTITNCLFLNNTTTAEGAGIANGGGTASTKIMSCTFYGNTGLNTINNQSNVTITNSIVWGNGGGVSGGTVTYSTVQGGFLGTGNLNTDPRFVDAGGGDFRLQQCSPAIDKGTNTNAPTTDYAGNTRPFNATGVSNTDIGAYEYQSTYDICSACVNITGGIIYVNASSLGTNNGSSWTNAFTDLQSALSLARSYPSCVSQIWVAAGNYRPTSGTDRGISFSMVNGVAIYGGFDGTETQLTQRNWRTNATILSGNIGDTGVDTDNTYRVINNTFTSGSPLNNTAILDGFIVEKGYANTSPFNLGGGMWNAYASPMIRNCVFRNNFAVGGGGMFNAEAQPTITNCLFLNNTTTAEGAGIANGGGTASTKVMNCTFYGNTGPNTINNQSNVTITNCIVWGNGGGISGGTVTYSTVQGGFLGTGNLNTDPRFVDAGGGDFRLQQCSPAIDAVTNTNAPTADFEGNARPFNATGVNNADMGAYEYRSAYDVCSVCATSTELTISTLIHNRTGTVGYWRGCGIYGLYKVRITAKGAKGGNNGGAGAVMIGEFIVSPGQVLESVAGASGGDGNRGGGGGGSGTRIQGGLPLIIAGGGGGNSGGGFGLITKGNGQGGNWLVTGGGGGGGLNGSGFGGVMGGGAGFNALGGSASGNGGGGYGGGGGGTGLHAGGGGGQTGGTAITPSSGGASYNLGSNQNNTEGANNAGGQVIIEYLGTASLSATATASQPTCATPNQGSVSIDLTGDLTGNTSGGVEYAIVSGGSFSGNPTFADVTADPLNLTAGTGTTLGTYTVRIRLKYNPDLYIDRTYTISPKLTGTIYVKANATGANNGTTWTDAFTSLQDALSAVCSGAQIWVAAGTYKPTADASGNMAPTDARTRTFVMKDGVAIYGGFNGTETQLSQRNWVANETILSGDIDGTPDVVTGSGSTLSITGNDGNSYHVIYNDNNGLSNSAILDGFTVSGGNASAISGLNNNGGGMYNNNASPTVVNCKFIYNNASNSGGGAYFNSSNITIDNCSFNLNSSGLGGGFNISSSSIAVNHCQYTGNRAKTGSGGGINVTSTASLTMSSCQVTENSAISFGGGINSFGVLTILSSQINNNTAANGGGVAQANRELIMNNCEIRNNRTIFQSAGINLQDVSSAILTNCVISGNESQSSQGGISLMTYNATNSQATLINCTVANNKSVNGFGAIWTYVDQSGKTATFTLKNSIVANNPGGNFLRGNQPTNPVYFGTIQSQGNNLDSDGSSGFSNGINGDLVNVDPLFVSSTDSRLQACSPAINAGDPATTSALVGNLDLDTNPRFFNNGTVDMGAYEYQGTFDAVAPAAQVTNSVCTTFGSTPSGGVISAPSGSCPAGSSLYYSTNNGDNWSTTLPIYVQEGPAQTILTRCTCDANPSTFGPTSTVTTVPGTCPACPDLTSAAPAVQVTNSVCTTFGGTASGGVISAPSSSCPAGSTLQYSTDNGGNWSITLPTYEQTGSGQTILTRCNCTADASKSSPTSTMTTVPGTCPACPDLTAAAPAVQVTNSVCTTFGGTASGGVISAPSSSCPAGSTLQYSTDNGGNWSITLPTYEQTGSGQTILTRCNCTADASKSSPTSTMTTVPGTCPACPDLTAAAPAVQVTNSVCATFGGTASGGSISAPSSSCPAGSTLYYSTDNGGNWSKTLPSYEQTGPAQTILTRCTCDANANTSSPTSTITTVPGVCPACPVLMSAAPVVQVTNSVCTTFGGTASGGSISAPSSSCPVGSTLYYSTDNGGNWSKTLPSYEQTGPAQTILTRCTCDANANTSSPKSTVTTVPGVCPACPVLTAVAPAVQVTNSVCQTGCVIGGGSIAVPSTSCSVGSTLQYQLNGGDWSTTLPTYVQTGPAQTIKTRCVCNSNASQTSPESSVTTVPGTVPMLVVPSNGSAVVSCPALAMLPVPPVVNDCSGAAITPSSPTITNSPDPLTCEGTRTYTYTYVCGTRTASWSFVYTIEREGFTVSTPNGSATVYDASLAVAPTPPTVLSQCGETLTPSAPVITNSPNPLVCEGTRTYTYTFTDCEGNTASWSYVYTILDNIAPSITCPANITACEGQTITFTPPVGTDNCLGAVTTQIAGLPTSSLYPVGITTNTYKVTATNGQSSTCSFTVTVQGKPTITLSTLQQTLTEGNNPVLCDTDANPVNSLQFNVSGLCVSGSPVWRVQVGRGAWSTWSATAPVSQPSNNQPHRYQAACDASCASTYSGVIELTINNRATVPQNVSLLVDGVTVLVGESKEVCSLVTIPLTFNANCAAGEVTLYSVDGGEYSSGVPTGLVDNQYHNYRVRCRKSDGTASCVESESGVMRLKLVTIPSAPTVSLSSTSSCDATASFSGLSNCGNLRTVWYNASTNVALPNLPSVVPSQTTSYYARCQTENGCVSEKSNVVTFTLTSTQVAPVITASQEIVCTGTSVTISANCPSGSQTFWNTGVTTPSFEVSFNNVTKQTYWAKCVFAGGCQSAESVRKDIYWNAFVVTLINVGESKSSVKVNDRAAWTSQFITRDGGPELEQSTQQNPTLYFVENVNKVAPRYWTINVEACGLSTDGSLTFDMLATPEMGVVRSFNTHENNAPYFMYANREGWTELYAQNHPAYGFYQDNGAGGNVYDAGLPKGLYKLGVRYWDQKGWGSIYPSTRKPQGNVLAYQEYWFRIQSKNGVGVGAAREAISDLSSRRFADARDLKPADNGSFATILPNPVTNTLRLQVQNSKEQVVQTTLTDASGREVLNRQFVPETNSHQEEFEVGELPTGMYFLRVTTPDRQTTLKVVKLE